MYRDCKEALDNRKSKTTGTTGPEDSLTDHNGHNFSTKDRDNDAPADDFCAVVLHTVDSRVN